MFFFKRRKKEKTLEKKFDELNEEILTEKDKNDPDKIERYVIERLEQMVETIKEVEDEKSEYRVVTSYLNDIQILEGLTEEQAKPIHDVAVNIVSLNRTRDELIHSEKKITDVQFSQMQQEEADMPNAIRRLRENEQYLDMIKRDMKYLEREKTEWQLYEEILEHDRENLQKLMYIMAGLAAVAVVVLFILQIILQKDLKLAWTILIFLAALGICIPYLKMLNDQTEHKSAKRNANKAVFLLNKVKFRYVGIMNAVDYACEKYHVRNAQELEYTWECYMEAVKQREKFEQNSDDLDYFNNKMLRELAGFQLYDSRVWIPQAMALVDHKEMVEITHNLIARRQKLRSRMDYNVGALEQQRREITVLMKDVPQIQPKIEAILHSVDQLNSLF